MDGICGAVLNKIYALGGVGRYFIISEEEFFDSFPEDCKKDAAELEAALEKLKKEGYLDIKYSGGDMYCVALLKDEEPPLPPPLPQPVISPAPPQANSDKKLLLYAFLGGAAGGIVTALFALLFLLC